jgi:hypothetical protein
MQRNSGMGRSDIGAAVARCRHLIVLARASISSARSHHHSSPNAALRGCLAAAHAVGFAEALSLCEPDAAARTYLDFEAMSHELERLATELTDTWQSQAQPS